MSQLLNKIKIAKNTPLSILVSYLKNSLKRRTRKYYVKIRPTTLQDSVLFKTIGGEKQIFATMPPFFFNPNEKNAIVQTIRSEYPQSIQPTIDSADEICAHNFNLLGSGKTYLGDNIDWHRDFKSGFRWNPKTYYLWTRKHVTLHDDSDVKIPWELSRCQHFIVLGKAYWYTNDEKYAEEFVSQIESWIKENPVELGVNWACAMDVAIRAVNWIWGYYFFCNSITLTDEFKIKFHKSLFMHGRHIINNLEFGPIRGNHYLSDIVGLIYLGIFIPKCKESEKWLAKGLSALEEEMQFQVRPDGVDFEASISYHRLVTELFLSAVLLCKKNNLDIPAVVTDRLERMIDFVMHYTKPDGCCPLIGDADDGRLHTLSDNPINDHRYLLSVGAVVFNRPDLKAAYNTFNEEAFWLLGTSGLNAFRDIALESSSTQSKAYPDSGYYIMRDNDSYMIIRCGDVGLKGRGGHGHCDCLSFELFLNGKTVIVDPGAYVYTADAKARNLFRSTKYHNTIVVDGEEMNRFEEDGLFAMHYDAKPKLNKWISKREFDFFDGEHSGYVRLKEPVMHRRQIYFDKINKHYVIKDILTGTGKHTFDLYFHLSPIQIVKNELQILLEIGITIQPAISHGLKCDVQKGLLSESYGKKIESSVIRYSKTAELPFEFVTVISTKQNINLNEIDVCFHKIKE